MERSEEEIRDLIVTLTQATVEPTLTDNELDFLVRQSKRRDSTGLRPVDTGWNPTWNVNGAVAIGWELKAGKVATHVGFSSGTQKINRNELIQNMLAMAERWRTRDHSDVSLPSANARPNLGLHTVHDSDWELIWRLGGSGWTGTHPGGQWIDDP